MLQIVKDCESRLTGDQVDELLALVEKAHAALTGAVGSPHRVQAIAQPDQTTQASA